MKATLQLLAALALAVAANALIPDSRAKRETIARPEPLAAVLRDTCFVDSAAYAAPRVCFDHDGKLISLED